MSNITPWSAAFAFVASGCTLLAFQQQKTEYVAAGLTNGMMSIYVATSEARSKTERERLLQMIKSRPVSLKATNMPDVAPFTSQHVSPVRPTQQQPISRKPKSSSNVRPVLSLQSKNDAKLSKIDQRQLKRLIKLLQGDSAQAHRLIDYEMNNAPGKTRQWALEKTLGQLERDRA